MRTRAAWLNGDPSPAEWARGRPVVTDDLSELMIASLRGTAGDDAAPLRRPFAGSRRSAPVCRAPHGRRRRCTPRRERLRGSRLQDASPRPAGRSPRTATAAMRQGEAGRDQRGL
jgi:hypothetical protein